MVLRLKSTTALAWVVNLTATDRSTAWPRGFEHVWPTGEAETQSDP